MRIERSKYALAGGRERLGWCWDLAIVEPCSVQTRHQEAAPISAPAAVCGLAYGLKRRLRYVRAWGAILQRSSAISPSIYPFIHPPQPVHRVRMLVL